MAPPLFLKDVKLVNSKFCLSGAALKHIAMVCMLADHVNKAVLEPLLTMDSPFWLTGLCSVLGAVGRFAFPIFFFLLVEGFYNTSNRWKYLRNLILFAFFSEIPFNLFVSGSWWYWGGQNIFFTLALSHCVIWVIDSMRRRIKYWLLPMVLIVLAGGVIAEYGRLDYGSYGVLIPFAFYLFRSKPLAASLVGYLVIAEDVWSLPSFLLTCFYSGQRGRQHKWLNYWFYPLHLLLIAGIRLIWKL